MIPAAFAYERARSLDKAVDALGRNGPEAKILAGGQSLIPLMKLRLSRPTVVVDVSRVPELSGIRDEGEELAIGACVIHEEVSRAEAIASFCPILSRAASEIGDPQVRHMGTIGGAVAHADPAGDLSVALLAVGARFGSVGPSGVRYVAAADFFVGAFTTSLAPDEVLFEVRVPKVPGLRWSFIKFRRRALDWATVGVAAISSTDGPPAVALASMGDRPLRASATERAVAEGASLGEAAGLADVGTEPVTDVFASGEYRRALAKVLVRRALTEVTHR